MEEKFIKDVIENYNYLKGNSLISKEKEIELLKEAILASYFKKNKITKYNADDYEVVFNEEMLFVMKNNITVFMNPIDANGISINDIVNIYAS